MTGLQKKQENIFAVMMLTDNITIVLITVGITVGRHDVDDVEEDDDGHLEVGNGVVDTCVQ